MSHRTMVFAALMAACSAESFETDLKHSQLTLAEETDAEPFDDFPEETPLKPLTLPYVLDGTCAGTTCDAKVLSNVSNEELLERDALMPEQEFELAEKYGSQSIESATEATSLEAAALIASGNPEERMELSVYLPELLFDFRRLRNVESDEEYQTLWNERTQQLEESQNAAQEAIQREGGKVLGRLQLTNVLYAELPARGLAGLRQQSVIRGFEKLGTGRPDSDGLERRLALAMNADALQYWGWDGGSGSNETPPCVLA